MTSAHCTIAPYPKPDMSTKLVNLTYEIELQTGEKLTLPDEVADRIGEGRWLITIALLTNEPASTIARRHHAFLNGYAPEDEGLYDDYSTG